VEFDIYDQEHMMTSSIAATIMMSSCALVWWICKNQCSII